MAKFYCHNFNRQALYRVLDLGGIRCKNLKINYNKCDVMIDILALGQYY